MTSTIKEAVLAALADWKSGGQTNLDRMREQVQWLVDEAIDEFHAENVDLVTDEEE